MPHLTEAQEELVQKAFDAIDADGNGSIDKNELENAVSEIVGHTPTESEVREMMARADADGNGKISFPEFKKIMAEHLSKTTNWGKLQTKLSGYVGIDNISEQLKRKSLKKGFEFNIMVVGESGLGKSTMVNTLFMSKISRASTIPESREHRPKTVEVHSVSHVIDENGVRVRLTVTDTPGFGDQINNDNCWQPILDHVNQQYERYFAEERAVNRRRRIPDSRVHCCLYFIAPTGHSLKPIDVEFMKRLDKAVNIVPVIAKSDSLTEDERVEFKKRIKEDFEQHGIRLYPFDSEDDTEDDAAANDALREAMPFAVVGSETGISVGGKTVLGRKTKWGLIEVENEKHSEFPLLRNMLIRSHLQDLVEQTDKIHYESFRKAKLAKSSN